LNIAGCVVLEWEWDRGLFIWGLGIAGSLVLELKEGEWLVYFVDLILLSV
jgi:hypothetical protein